MTGEPQTILLTSSDRALVAALADRLPALRVLAGQSLPPSDRLVGRTWCFVD